MNLDQMTKAITRKSLAYAQDVAEPFAEGAMDHLIIISRTSEGGYDEDTREYTPPGSTLVYDDLDFPGLGGPAGVKPTSGPLNMDLGQEMQYWSSIQVHIPESILMLPMVEDTLEIVYSRTRGMAGRQFTIRDVEVGGRISSSITLRADGIAPSRTWSQP